MAKAKSAASKRPAKSTGEKKPDSVVGQIDESIPQVTDPKVRADLLSLRFRLLVLMEDNEKLAERPSTNFQNFWGMDEEQKAYLQTWGQLLSERVPVETDGQFATGCSRRDQHADRILESLDFIRMRANNLPPNCYTVTQALMMLFEQDAHNIRPVTEEELGRIPTEKEWLRVFPRRIPNRLIERAIDSIDLIVKRIAVEKVLVSLADVAEVIRGRKDEAPKDWQDKIQDWGVPEVQDAAGRHRKWFLFKILPTLRRQFPYAHERIDAWIKRLNLI